MEKIYNWGIIGPGKIANKFALALANVPNARLHAVASRDLEKARQFSEKHGGTHYYGSYEALAGNRELDAVYIATPHTFHHDHALLCLENKIPVLCEKPMSVNLQTTQAIINSAKANNTFLMEAMWTRFLPHINKTLELIKAGEIGEVKHVRADFGFVFPYDASSRLFNMQLGGGSLLDVGVYPLFLALLLLGKPDQIKSFATLSPTGSDESTDALLYYKNGRSASIYSSVASQTPLTAEIYGTEGLITLRRPWYKGTEIEVLKKDTIAGTFSIPYGENGFEFEIMEVQECIKRGEKESRLMSLPFSLLLSETMDMICSQIGVVY